MNKPSFKEVAFLAMRDAGNILMDNFKKVSSFSFKAKSNIVTEIDNKAEKVILQHIQSYFPDHAILSEEAGASGENSAEYMWVIDPLDGTINYFYNVGPFSTGLCLLQNKQPILSVIYNPLGDEMYVAEKGKGTFVNDIALHVSSNNDTKSSVIMTHLSSKAEPRQRTIAVLSKVFDQVMQIRMMGSGFTAMSYIAEGRSDGFFQVSIKAWDLLPGVLLIEEAGGRVTDIAGNPITFESDSVLATNGNIHKKMLKLLENV